MSVLTVCMCKGRTFDASKDFIAALVLDVLTDEMAQMVIGFLVMKMGDSMKNKIYFVALLASFTTVGCSTITQSETQPLSLTASFQGKAVDPECRLKNDKGSWDAKAPANVTIRKSGEDLEVTCKKEGMPDGLLKAISRAAGSMFGNIIFGGGIGALIDHSKGTGYDYPDQLPVKMGESVVVDKKVAPQTAQQACSPGQQC